VATAKSAWFATASIIEKQLCSTARPELIYQDSIPVIVSKNNTLSKTTRKWNLHFFCLEKNMRFYFLAILFVVGDSVWSDVYSSVQITWRTWIFSCARRL